MLPPSPLLPELSFSGKSYCSISSHALLDLIDNHGHRSNRLYNIHITHTHICIKEFCDILTMINELHMHLLECILAMKQCMTLFLKD